MFRSKKNTAEPSKENAPLDKTNNKPECKPTKNEQGNTVYKKVKIVNGKFVVQNCCPEKLIKKENGDGTFTCDEPIKKPKISLKKSTIVQPQTDQPQAVQPQSVRNNK